MIFEQGRSHSQVRIVGTVAGNVARVEVKVPSGCSFLAQISRRLNALGMTRHFFLAEGRVRFTKSPRGSRAQRFTLLAYDAHGRLLQHLP